MISQRCVACLLGLLALFAVSSTIVMGFALLFGALGDTIVAGVLRWVGGACAMAMVVDLALLVVAIAIRSLPKDE